MVVDGTDRRRIDSRRLDKYSQEKCDYHEDYDVTAENLTITTNKPKPPKTVTCTHVRWGFSLPTSETQKTFGFDSDEHNNTLIPIRAMYHVRSVRVRDHESPTPVE